MPPMLLFILLVVLVVLLCYIHIFWCISKLIRNIDNPSVFKRPILSNIVGCVFLVSVGLSIIFFFITPFPSSQDPYYGRNRFIEMQSARAKQNQIESEYYIQLFLLCAWDLGLFVVWITSLKTEKVRSLWRKKYNRPQTPIPILNKSDRLILKCPSCQGEIQVPKMRVGQYVSCPTCSKMVLARQELTELSPQEALGMMKENKTTKDER